MQAVNKREDGAVVVVLLALSAIIMLVNVVSIALIIYMKIAR